MEGHFFTLSTAGDIPDFKGLGLKDPDGNTALNNPKISYDPRSYYFFFRSNLRKKIINTYQTAKFIYMDDHIIPFLPPRKELNSTIRKKAKIKSRWPSSVFISPGSSKIPSRTSRTRGLLTLKWKYSLLFIPIPCTPESLNQFIQTESPLLWRLRF